jgi:hypothetical protein
MLLIDEQASLAAIPSMLASDAETRNEAFDVIKEVMHALGKLATEDDKRLREVSGLFGVEQAQATTIPFPRREVQARAS